MTHKWVWDVVSVLVSNRFATTVLELAEDVTAGEAGIWMALLGCKGCAFCSAHPSLHPWTSTRILSASAQLESELRGDKVVSS